MQKISDINQLRLQLQVVRQNGDKIGFIPTMGYLHQGHISLIKLAQKECEVVVVSIFVNPTQFNNPEDLEKYPRDEARDLSMLKEHGVNFVFMPAANQIYSPDHQFSVNVGALATRLEGPFRPGHFEGVATVVTILFNIVQPNLAVFGEKDFQQLRIIEQLTSDLKMNIKIIRGPTLREPDGLAMSSRNVRLNSKARESSLLLSKVLFEAQERVRSGVSNSEVILRSAKSELSKYDSVKLEYLAIVDEKNLNEISEISTPCRALIAAWIDGVRLIDNIRLG